MKSDYGDAFYLHHTMSAAECLKCQLDFAYPVRWEMVDYGGVAVLCACSNCDASYALIMSWSQARKWDDEIGEQYANIKKVAAALRLVIDREAAERDG